MNLLRILIYYYKRLSLLILLLFIILNNCIISQTNVSGVISSNTIWTLSGSPYIVTGNVLVNSGVNLTINPGVVVKFNSGKALQIEGELSARGTAGSYIRFTSNQSSPAAGDWGYIYFSSSSVSAQYDGTGNYVSGCILEYCIVEYAGGVNVGYNGSIRIEQSAPFINCSTIKNGSDVGIFAISINNTLRVTNSSIYYSKGISVNGGTGIQYYLNDTIRNNNGDGLYSYYSQMVIMNCLISQNNGYGCNLNYSKSVVEHNTIINNNNAGITAHSVDHISKNLVMGNAGGGIEYYTQGGEGNLYNNIICQNTNTINYPASGIYLAGGNCYNNTIINNFSQYYSVYLSYSSFSNNLVSGNSNTSSTNFSCINIGPSLVSFVSNNIINNFSTYQVMNEVLQGSGNIIAINNWWGTTNSDAIQTKIYDWFVDPTKSIVTFTPFLTSPDASAPIAPPMNVIKYSVTGGIKLQWSANTEEDLSGYKIYWGSPTGYSFSNSVDVGNVTSYILNGVSLTDTVAVTAYDKNLTGTDDQFNGNESWYSTPQIYSLTLTSPKGAEQWVTGSSHNITWTSSNISNIKIEYSTDNGTYWTSVIASTPASASTYNWTIPVTPSTQCKVKITDVSNALIASVNANPFTIVQPSITISSPAGGESWQVGSSHNITWTSVGVVNAKIEYTTDNGTNWSTVIASTPASGGSYNWAIPNTPSTQCKVRISDESNGAVNNINANVFTIFHP